MKPRTSFLSIVSALLWFSPSLAALGQAVVVVILDSNAPRGTSALLSAVPNTTSIVTFTPGPYTRRLMVSAYPVGQETDGTKRARLRVEAFQHKEPVRVRYIGGVDGDHQIAIIGIKPQAPCVLKISRNSNLPPDAAMYTVHVQAIYTADAAALITGFVFYAGIFAVPSAIVYKRRKRNLPK